ncbi:MAG: hypothetical protein GY790_09945 [Bacteroidetes bacterium]|nr:hypothetical protein [Bacteroidota bacterium]
MRGIRIFSLIAVLFIGFSIVVSGAPRKDSPPKIIFVFVDDKGFRDLGSGKSSPLVHNYGIDVVKIHNGPVVDDNEYCYKGVDLYKAILGSEMERRKPIMWQYRFVGNPLQLRYGEKVISTKTKVGQELIFDGEDFASDSVSFSSRQVSGRG